MKVARAAGRRGTSAPPSPGPDQPAIGAELNHTRVYVAVGNVDITLASHRDVRRLVKVACVLTRHARRSQGLEEPSVRIKMEHDMPSNVSDPEVIPVVHAHAMDPPARHFVCD